MQLYLSFFPDIAAYRRYLLDHWDDLSEFSHHLADDESRKTLEKVICGRVTGDIQFYRDCYAEEQYYSPDIIRFSEDEVMVELGANDGETLLRFIELCPQFQSAYCFEPNDELIPILLRIKEEQKPQGRSIIIINKGAWDKTEKLSFTNNDHNSALGSLVLDNAGSETFEVDVTTVDEAVPEKISFMKMDIEGSELKALHGAEQHIRANKPKLAVCVYHKPEDILDIWFYLRELVPEYSFYLRHHCKDAGTETVLYAVKKN